MNTRMIMSLGEKILQALLVTACFATIGCRQNSDKVTPPKDDSSKMAKVAPEGEQDDSTTQEPVITVDEPKGIRSRISVETPQRQRVFLAGDHDPWADRVVSFKMGKPAARICTDPQTTLGKPDYALRRQAKTCLSMGHRGELVVEFVDNGLVDGPGDDLAVFEVGPVVEPMDVAISVDGKAWISVGQLQGAKSTVDIGLYLPAEQRYIDRPRRDQPVFRFVKITDAGAGLSNKSDKAGADIDAIGALNSVPVR